MAAYWVTIAVSRRSGEHAQTPEALICVKRVQYTIQPRYRRDLEVCNHVLTYIASQHLIEHYHEFGHDTALAYQVVVCASGAIACPTVCKL